MPIEIDGVKICQSQIDYLRELQEDPLEIDSCRSDLADIAGFITRVIETEEPDVQKKGLGFLVILDYLRGDLKKLKFED